MKASRRVAVLGGVRIPFVKSFAEYSKTTNQEMLTHTISALADRFNLKGKIIGDVALGAVMVNSSDWNLAREVVLGSGLHPYTPGYNVQRACGTSLETALQIALKIGASQIDVGIAGGSDTNSDLPVMAKREMAWELLELRKAKTLADKAKRLIRFNPKMLIPDFPAVVEPRTGMSMGEHCEKMVKEWKIPREAQDALALQSHKNAAAAYDEGFYDDLVTEFKGLKRDTIVRKDTSMEKLLKLKPAFDRSEHGTLTAGNSTNLTDGASSVLLSSEEYAKKAGIPVQAYFVDAQVSALDFVGGDGLLMAPTVAVSELLKRNNLTFDDFDFFEIHEAFAGQVLCTLKAWESEEFCRNYLNREKPLGSVDRKKMNTKGGSVALGHPFGATGGRIVGGLAKLLSQKKGSRGLISICTGGGMGVAAIMVSDK